MRWFVGTSGFSYPEWKGSFYPDKMKPADMLRFYAEHFATVEINASFYRMPTPAAIAGWAAQVPDDFRFVLKASRRITHDRRLGDVAEPLTFFLSSALTLGPRLGAVLYQLPPNFKKDAGRLRDFLAQIPAAVPAAFEFRNVSWFDDETFGLLRGKGAALCIADTEDGVDTPFVATAPWGYVRLRDVDYSEDELGAWVDRIRGAGWNEVHVFFKHEDAGRGPEFARRLTDRVGLERGKVSPA